MKLKHLLIGFSCFFVVVFSLLLIITILSSDEQDGGFGNSQFGGATVSMEVLAHKPMVEKYAKEYGVSEYVNVLLAIMQVESGGTAKDVMQSSESLGLPPNSLDELAQSFAKEHSGGVKVDYPNSIAISMNGGWRYSYGNMFYVALVKQYLVTSQFDDETAQAIMNEALKYEGWKYVFGGSSPTTSFDCSGLVQWCYGKAGISLPRTAQAQYDATQHISLSEAKAGDLIFFHSTYNSGTYITHVGIYVGNNRMYHAGDPIGYTDLTSSYWQQHLAGAGRIKR